VFKLKTVNLQTATDSGDDFCNVAAILSFVLNLWLVLNLFTFSNGKLPPRTCPGCSVPEPYQPQDWALVPAKPGLQG